MLLSTIAELAFAIYYIEKTVDYRKSSNIFTASLSIQMIEMSAVALLVTIALINYFKVTSLLKKDVKLATNTLYSFSIVCMTWLLVSIISYGLQIKNYQHLGVYDNVH